MDLGTWHSPARFNAFAQSRAARMRAEKKSHAEARSGPGRFFFHVSVCTSQLKVGEDDTWVRAHAVATRPLAMLRTARPAMTIFILPARALRRRWLSQIVLADDENDMPLQSAAVPISD
jgi:hypothetical protein